MPYIGAIGQCGTTAFPEITIEANGNGSLGWHTAGMTAIKALPDKNDALFVKLDRPQRKVNLTFPEGKRNVL